MLASSLSTCHYNALDSAIVPPQPPQRKTQETQILTSPACSTSGIVTALRDISSKLEYFETRLGTFPLPESTNVADTVHLARQIAHWSSLFVNKFQENTHSSVAPLSIGNLHFSSL